MKLTITLIFLIITQLAYCQETLTFDVRKQLREHANKRVVLLGEPTHGEGNVIEYKTEIVKFLHDSLGFNVIAFESGLFDMHLANKLIKQNPQTHVTDYLDNSLFPVWTNSRSFQSFINYLEKNKSCITLAGFDCQLSGSYSVDSLLSTVSSFLNLPNQTKNVDFTLIQEAVEHYAMFYDYPTTIDNNRLNQELTNLIKLVKEQQKKNKDQLLSLCEQALKCIYVMGNDYYAKRHLQLNEDNYKAEYSNIRDSLMAQNLLFLLSQYPTEKIICWGAMTHFASATSKIDNIELTRYAPMGMHLQKKIGAHNIFNLGFISNKGSYGIFSDSNQSIAKPIENSIESLNNPTTPYFINLKSKSFNSRKIYSYAIEHELLRADWGSVFDALIQMPEFTPNEFYEKEVITVPKVIVANTSHISLDSCFHGKITDSHTRKPIEFATVKIVGTNTATVSNESGEFMIKRPTNEPVLVAVYLLGYDTTFVSLVPSKSNTIVLSQKTNVLQEVNVNAKKINVDVIIKEIKENYLINYEIRPYSQRAYASYTISNLGSEILNIDNVIRYSNLDFRYWPIMFREEERVNVFDTSSLKKIGSTFVSLGQVNRLDFLQHNRLFLSDFYKEYDFELVNSFLDSSQGLVYKIKFMSNKLNYRITKDFFTKVASGEMTVRKEDFAILSIQYDLTRNVRKLRKAVNKYYSKHSYLWSIMPDSEMYSVYCLYEIRPETGKYFLKTATLQFYERGYFMVDKQPVDIVQSLSFYSLGNATLIENVDRYKYSRQYSNDKNFWDTFKNPYISTDNKK